MEITNKSVNQFQKIGLYLNKSESWGLNTGLLYIISNIYINIYIYLSNIKPYFKIWNQNLVSQNHSHSEAIKVASPPLWNSKINVDDACTHHRNYFPAIQVSSGLLFSWKLFWNSSKSMEVIWNISYLENTTKLYYYYIYFFSKS